MTASPAGALAQGARLSRPTSFTRSSVAVSPASIGAPEPHLAARTMGDALGNGRAAVFLERGRIGKHAVGQPPSRPARARRCPCRLPRHAVLSPHSARPGACRTIRGSGQPCTRAAGRRNHTDSYSLRSPTTLRRRAKPSPNPWTGTASNPPGMANGATTCRLASQQSKNAPHGDRPNTQNLDYRDGAMGYGQMRQRLGTAQEWLMGTPVPLYQLGAPRASPPAGGPV